MNKPQINKIKYKDGYKYQLCEDYEIQTLLYPQFGIAGELITLTQNGRLLISKSYSWDGASGPTFDSKNSMRASLVHDALYQLMREDHLPMSNRPIVDRLFYDICVEDGMFKWRAWLWYQAVKRFALGAAAPENDRKVITAP